MSTQSRSGDDNAGSEESDDFFAALRSLQKPWWLIEGTLMDNRWVVATEDASSRRDARRIIRFDDPVGYGFVRLTDADRKHDLLTAKLYFMCLLDPRFDCNTTVSGAQVQFRQYLTFIRWRLSRGIFCNSDLSKDWFEEYLDCLCEKGLEEFTNSSRNIRNAIVAHRDGELKGVEFPRSTKASKMPFYTVLRYAGYEHANEISSEASAMLEEYMRTLGVNVLLAKSGRIALRPKKQSLQIFLHPWDRLWRFRDELKHDAIPCNVYSDISLRQISKGLPGVKSRRTPTLPALQACFLIDRALRWVIVLAPQLLAIRDRFLESPDWMTNEDRLRSAFAACPTDFRTVFEEISSAVLVPTEADMTPGRFEITYQDAIFNHLAAACFIVLSAFTARRRMETMSISEDSLIERDGEYWLKTWHLKGAKRAETIPIPKVCEMALRVMFSMPRRPKAEGSGTWLFNFQALVPEEFYRALDRVYFHPNRAIRAFAELVSVPPLADGTAWHLTTHQFRRFFAVIYFYRYRYKSLTALSDFLRHYDPDATRQYITEASKGGFLKLADEQNALHAKRAQNTAPPNPSAKRRYEDFIAGAAEFRSDIYQGAYWRRERIAGFGAKTILGEIEAKVQAYAAQMDIVSADDLGEMTINKLIQEYAVTTSLEPSPLGHSYCKCRPLKIDTAVAACVIEAERADPHYVIGQSVEKAHVVDVTCSGCPHNVQLTENREYWIKAKAETVSQLEGARGGLKVRLSQRLRQIEDHLSRCFPE